MKIGIYAFAGAALLSVGVAACGAAPGDQQTSQETLAEPSLERLQTLNHDLGIGSRGEDVHAVHAYLKGYGYFPNDKLRREYPAWRPVVAVAPVDVLVYDEQTADAIRHLQQGFNLDVTGLVDAPTREVLRMGRCGVPEGLPKLDSSEKFSFIDPNYWGTGPQPKWWIENDTFNSMHNRTQEAIDTWSAETSLNFVNASSGYDILIRFEVPTFSGAPMETSPGWPMVIRVSPNESFYYGTGAVPATQWDYRTIILHELGHALGLGHSSWALGTESAVMWPGGPKGSAKRALSIDDKVGVSLLHDTATQIPTGLALDIGVSPVKVNGKDVVWVIGTDGSIWKWDGGNSWIHEVANGWAERIAVDAQGIPYVAASWGVYRRTSADPLQGTWQMINGACALDVGVGTVSPMNPSPVVWMVGCDHDVYKFDGLWWSLDPTFLPAHTASRLAVDTEALPWVINTSGTVWRRTTPTTTSGWYIDLPGTFYDVGVATAPYAWGITRTPVSGGYWMMAFNYQAGNPGDPSGMTPAQWQWQVFGSGTNVAVGADGKPWWTRSSGTIFRTTK